MDKSSLGHPLLSIILVDSEMEMVPKEYWSHPAVVANSAKRKKRPSQVLLDSNLHHSIFKDRNEKNRRGRPDIVHQFLLIGLESILNQEGALNLYVHTRNDELITISPSTRLPKNYNRYSGLFEELFRSGSVPPGKDPLIKLIPGMDIGSVLTFVMDSADRISSTRVFLMAESGRSVDILDEISDLSSNSEGSPFHLICLIGGFPSGDFRSDVRSLCSDELSIFDAELKAWVVEMELISAFHHGGLKGNRTSGGA